MISLFIIVPLAYLVALNLLPRRARESALPFWGTAIISLLQIASVIFHPEFFWDTANPGVPFLLSYLTVDNLSLVLILSIGVVTLTTLFVARYIIDSRSTRFNFISLLIIALTGMNGTVMVSDLFSLYVFIEITAVSSFILIAQQREKLALEGAFKYIILSAIATVLMLSAIAILVMVTGSTTFITVSALITTAAASVYVKVALALFLAGLFIKSGVVPFHGWLPDAYSAAPAPVSVLLAGIVTKTTGVYALMRVVITVFGFSPFIQNTLMFVGALSIVVGAFAALRQKDFKRMLAYSSISQVGYIVLSLGCGTKLAIAGAAFHLLNHAIFKTLLFANSASIEKRLGTTHMDQMKGLASKMRITSATSLIGFLSTAGIPPLAGFWSKFIIVIALWSAGNHAYAAVALLASILTLAYFLTMQRRTFFCKAETNDAIEHGSIWIAAPEILLAVAIVGIGIFYPFVLNNLILSVGNILR